MAARSTPLQRSRPRTRRNKTQIARRLVQGAFLLFILFASLRHSLFEETTTAVSYTHLTLPTNREV